MARVFISGSEGFIGKYLCKALSIEGHMITTLDLVYREAPNHFQASILDFDFDSTFRSLEIDYVIHLAAQTNVLESFLDPEFDLLVNGKGTLRIALAAKRAGCKNFVYAHSGGASFSNPSKYPTEESEPKSPISPYGISKNVGLDYLRYLGHQQEFGWIALALSNCFGPVVINKKGVIYEFWRAEKNQLPANIYGPDVTRDFVFIDDVVNAFVLALEKPLKQEINISSSVEISLSNLYKIQSGEMKSQILPVVHPARVGEVERSALDNRLARKLLNWSPTTDLKDGIRLSLGVNH